MNSKNKPIPAAIANMIGYYRTSDPEWLPSVVICANGTVITQYSEHIMLTEVLVEKKY